MPPGAKGEAAKAADPAKVTMSDLQPNAPGEYTVVKGDTLWGIAGKFLKDPWKWPQVWQMNREQIKDPHWIYPGNVIRLDTSGGSPSLSLAGGANGPSGGTAQDAERNLVKIDPRTRISELATAIPSIPGHAIGPFLSQPLVVEAGGLDNAPEIVATEESRVVVGSGNIAYAERLKQADGTNWQVFRPGAELRDPETGETLGFEAKYLGDARVKRFGNPATLEVVKARQEINRGDRLLPARETSFPNFVPHAPDKPIKGAIMSVDGGVSELGQFQIITINRGSRDGIEVGHVLASYRRGEPITGRSQNMDSFADDFFGPMRRWFARTTGSSGATPVPDAAPASGDANEIATMLPDERNGLVFVFRVFEKMSYAMVMRSTRPLYVNDVVRTP